MVSHKSNAGEINEYQALQRHGKMLLKMKGNVVIANENPSSESYTGGQIKVLKDLSNANVRACMSAIR